MSTSHPEPDWNPTSPEVQRDQRAAYDEMRHRCPVAYSEFMGWSLFRHEDVLRVLLDHRTFSSAVSQHLSVPSGMNQPEHTPYRRIIESYFSAPRMAAFEPNCRGIATRLVRDLNVRREVEFMAEAALPFAVQVQCAFLGWPAALQEPLVRWTRKNHEATLAQDRKAISEIALEFEGIIDDLLETRLQANAGPEADITAALMHENVWGRPLSNEELASILRNWTVGEIGTISASVGILTHYLAEHADLQKQLRAQPDLLPAAIEEILRLFGPLVSNRRITPRPVEIGGRKIAAGERITLMWISANRDESVFADPDSFRLDRDYSKNLLWGAGIHVCPGAPLAQLEMKVFLEALLAHTQDITTNPQASPTLAVYPASGFATLPLRIRSA
ncbi:MAG: cytochrome P450 [Chthoniobacterales bacterium]|nr:cytochrome P450 [Chthoniobacterales bacterium]